MRTQRRFCISSHLTEGASLSPSGARWGHPILNALIAWLQLLISLRSSVVVMCVVGYGLNLHAPVPDGRKILFIFLPASKRPHEDARVTWWTMDESRRGCRLALQAAIRRPRRCMGRRKDTLHSGLNGTRSRVRRSIRTLGNRWRKRFARAPLECHRLRYTFVCRGSDFPSVV